MNVCTWAKLFHFFLQNFHFYTGLNYMNLFPNVDTFGDICTAMMMIVLFSINEIQTLYRIVDIFQHYMNVGHPGLEKNNKL